MRLGKENFRFLRKTFQVHQVKLSVKRRNKEERFWKENMK